MLEDDLELHLIGEEIIKGISLGRSIDIEYKKMQDIVQYRLESKQPYDYRHFDLCTKIVYEYRRGL